MADRKTVARKALSMGTTVHIEVITSQPEEEALRKIERVLQSFHLVESVCSRFSDDSEVRQLFKQPGSPVRVSDMLFELVRFALTVASLTNGSFDPAVGSRMTALGFKHHYLTGQPVTDELEEHASVSFRDVQLDEKNRTLLLKKPLLLDLGALAKGFAIDLAVKELQPFEGFLVEAGGDLYVGGLNARDEPWQVGIRHPLRHDENIGLLRLFDTAVCTSGGYERKNPQLPGEHHLIVPQTGRSRTDVLSCTVIAPYAMLADAFSTAAFILGPDPGLGLLQSGGLEGLFVLPSVALKMTPGFVMG